MRALTQFRRYRGRRVPFSCFARPYSFSAVSGASGPVFMFCSPGLVFGGPEGVGSRFHVLRSRTCFRRYRRRQVPFSCSAHPDMFSCFALPGSFSAVTAASCLVFLFCARSFFRRFHDRRVPFSTVPRASGLVSALSGVSRPVFLIFLPGLVFCGSKGVLSCFHVLRVRTHFRRYRFHVLRAPTLFRLYLGRRVPFSRFALPDSFSAVPRASNPVIMFCAPRHVFGSTEGVGCFFHVLRTRTRFRQYRGRRVRFSRFAIPDLFSAVPGASCPVFLFCASGLIFVGSEGVVSHFHVLRARTYFRRFGGRRVPFSCFACPD
jgi:hypothetical protein